MKITVTGGASFIGSHLVECLLAEGHEVVVLDDLSSGSKTNLELATKMNGGKSMLFPIDLRVATPSVISTYLRDCELLYHLAADHGGRGYEETRQVSTSNNFALDNNVFQAAILVGVPKIIFASSGCVYPSIARPLFESDSKFTLLDDGHGRENSNHRIQPSGEGYAPDGLYGLAKLAGELTLAQMYREHGIESISCRFFTVFGPRAKENHAIISFIARAFIKQNPWMVWGDGQQIRDWTYVDDIVEGLLFSRSLSGCQALNLGTPEHLTVDRAIELVLELVRGKEGCNDYRPRIFHDETKPVGPRYRVGDSSHYLGLGGGKFTPFRDGLARTVDWYWKTHQVAEVGKDLERLLIDRK